MNEEETTTTEPAATPSFLDIIKDFPNAPNQAIVDEWKSKYGDIFFSGFSEKECYIWRAINRKEYRDLQINSQITTSTLEQAQGVDMNSKIKTAMDSASSQEEEIVSKCILWPKLTSEELNMKAGTIPTLFEQIMANSNFVTPAQAATLVIKI